MSANIQIAQLRTRVTKLEERLEAIEGRQSLLDAPFQKARIMWEETKGRFPDGGRTWAAVSILLGFPVKMTGPGETKE